MWKARNGLCKPYVLKTDEKGKIIFYLSNYSYYVENVMPLIEQYAHENVECICVFPSVSASRSMD